MAELIASIEAYGILQPLLVMLTGVLLAGHRRLKAAIELGLEYVPVIITDRILTDVEIRLIQLTENCQRAELTGWEKFLAFSDLMAMSPAWKMVDLAHHLQMDVSTVSRVLSISKTVGPVQDALREGKITISDGSCISKLSPELQPAMLALTLSGVGRDKIEAEGRKLRNPKPPTTPADDDKPVRIRMPLSKTATVTVLAPISTLDGLVETLSVALSNAKAANKEAHSLSTATAYWSQKNKG